MKLKLIFSAVHLSSVIALHAAVITQWNFNSPIPDGNTGTGTNAPCFGNGTATLLGGTTASYASGDTARDPAHSVDNSGWSTKKYPGAVSNNLSAGVRFDVDTTAYENINVSWSQQNSATASRYARLQCTSDGINFDAGLPFTILKDSVFTNFSFSLDLFPGARNNPAFGFRIMTEFENSAIGTGTNAYVATGTNKYSTAGTIRFDMVTVSGTGIPGGNTAPSISRVADASVHVNQTTSPLPFTITDAEDVPDNLRLTGTSSNPGIIPDASIQFSRSGTNCTVTVRAGAQPGSCTVTLGVVDTGGRSNATSFAVAVLPANTPPEISSIPATNTLAGTPTPAIDFTVSDLETGGGSLTVSGSSANPSLVPNTPSNIAFGGAGSNRTVTITPAPGQSGVAAITLVVSDGQYSASTAFPLSVRPSADTLVCEKFDYADGSLGTNSAGFWQNRSGTNGDCQVTSGQVLLTASRSEDVQVPLVGGPFVKGQGTVLYAGFSFKLLSLPKLAPSYFAGFANGSSMRGRIYAGGTNSLPRYFSLLAANGSDTNTVVIAVNLMTNTTHRVVTRYEVDTASTRVWLDAASEAQPSVTAVDAQTVTTISYYALRQSSDLGTALLMDDLSVGLTFDSVASSSSSGNGLRVQREGRKVILRWDGAGQVLQGAAVIQGPFTNVTGATSPYTNAMGGGSGFFRLR
jgi:hypothetical protein